MPSHHLKGGIPKKPAAKKEKTPKKEKKPVVKKEKTPKKEKNPTVEKKSTKEKKPVVKKEKTVKAAKKAKKVETTEVIEDFLDETIGGAKVPTNVVKNAAAKISSDLKENNVTDGNKVKEGVKIFDEISKAVVLVNEDKDVQNDANYMTRCIEMMTNAAKCFKLLEDANAVKIINSNIIECKKVYEEAAGINIQTLDALYKLMIKTLQESSHTKLNDEARKDFDDIVQLYANKMAPALEQFFITASDASCKPMSLLKKWNSVKVREKQLEDMVSKFVNGIKSGRSIWDTAKYYARKGAALVVTGALTAGGLYCIYAISAAMMPQLMLLFGFMNTPKYNPISVAEHLIETLKEPMANLAVARNNLGFIDSFTNLYTGKIEKMEFTNQDASDYQALKNLVRSIKRDKDVVPGEEEDGYIFQTDQRRIAELVVRNKNFRKYVSRFLGFDGEELSDEELSKAIQVSLPPLMSFKNLSSLCTTDGVKFSTNLSVLVGKAMYRFFGPGGVIAITSTLGVMGITAPGWILTILLQVMTVVGPLIANCTVAVLKPVLTKLVSVVYSIGKKVHGIVRGMFGFKGGILITGKHTKLVIYCI